MVPEEYKSNPEAARNKVKTWVKGTERRSPLEKLETQAAELLGIKTKDEEQAEYWDLERRMLEGID